ncbi:hypothetical protein DGo_PD0058 (plasmid) [Deinococcus gobiensis I-0]|uniref:Uncharacterized protein n=1 Tax=Deinococcus gobiensis (strain DSM 21396 / JCM 16679 / CGMCC 1.7299 / I-0) TaxID=745776 RepID=H8H3N5_DEIGI|nr:hypothetical protein DGo_PD0058 [Deinococcus gobiensis I-0]
MLSLLLLRTVVSGTLGTIWDHFPGNWEPGMAESGTGLSEDPGRTR